MQVFILDSLASYTASDDKEAEKITERVAPRLQHANCAVVLSAVKVGLLTCSLHLVFTGCRRDLALEPASRVDCRRYSSGQWCAGMLLVGTCVRSRASTPGPVPTLAATIC